MIPKIIHTSWISDDPFPENVQKCINSWKQKMPDYKIIIWDTTNFDFGMCDYVREAYAAKQWAFCADYIRMWALYNYGGIWFDTDVEVNKSFDGFLDRNYFFRHGICVVG